MLDARRVGVAGDVRQALLRDAVDRELRLVGERRQVVGEVAARPRIPLWSANLRESSVSALTRPRCSSISGRSSRAIRRTSSSACRTACLRLLDRRRGCRVGCERVELEQHAGEHLADLVVQAARDPQPLGLLRAAARGAPLSRRSASSRSSIWLKACTSSADLDAAVARRAAGPAAAGRPCASARRAARSARSVWRSSRKLAASIDAERRRRRRAPSTKRDATRGSSLGVRRAAASRSRAAPR